MDNLIYPGHAITLAVQIAQAFPTFEEADAPTPYNWPAALSCDKVHGAGGNVYAALDALRMLRGGLALDDVVGRADSAWRRLCAAQGWPAEVDEACEQARRYLQKVDLIEWVKR